MASFSKLFCSCKTVPCSNDGLKPKVICDPSIDDFTVRNTTVDTVRRHIDKLATEDSGFWSDYMKSVFLEDADQLSDDELCERYVCSRMVHQHGSSYMALFLRTLSKENYERKQMIVDIAENWKKDNQHRMRYPEFLSVGVLRLEGLVQYGDDILNAVLERLGPLRPVPMHPFRGHKSHSAPSTPKISEWVVDESKPAEPSDELSAPQISADSATGPVEVSHVDSTTTHAVQDAPLSSDSSASREVSGEVSSTSNEPSQSTEQLTESLRRQLAGRPQEHQMTPPVQTTPAYQWPNDPSIQSFVPQHQHLQNLGPFYRQPGPDGSIPVIFQNGYAPTSGPNAYGTYGYAPPPMGAAYLPQGAMPFQGPMMPGHMYQQPISQHASPVPAKSSPHTRYDGPVHQNMRPQTLPNHVRHAPRKTFTDDARMLQDSPAASGNRFATSSRPPNYGHQHDARPGQARFESPDAPQSQVGSYNASRHSSGDSGASRAPVQYMGYGLTGPAAASYHAQRQQPGQLSFPDGFHGSNNVLPALASASEHPSLDQARQLSSAPERSQSLTYDGAPENQGDNAKDTPAPSIVQGVGVGYHAVQGSPQRNPNVNTFPKDFSKVYVCLLDEAIADCIVARLKCMPGLVEITKRMDRKKAFNSSRVPKITNGNIRFIQFQNEAYAHEALTQLKKTQGEMIEQMRTRPFIVDYAYHNRYSQVTEERVNTFTQSAHAPARHQNYKHNDMERRNRAGSTQESRTVNQGPSTPRSKKKNKKEVGNVAASSAKLPASETSKGLDSGKSQNKATTTPGSSKPVVDRDTKIPATEKTRETSLGSVKPPKAKAEKVDEVRASPKKDDSTPAKDDDWATMSSETTHENWPPTIGADSKSAKASSPAATPPPEESKRSSSNTLTPSGEGSKAVIEPTVSPMKSSTVVIDTPSSEQSSKVRSSSKPWTEPAIVESVKERASSAASNSEEFPTLAEAHKVTSSKSEARRKVSTKTPLDSSVGPAGPENASHLKASTEKPKPPPKPVTQKTARKAMRESAKSADKDVIKAGEPSSAQPTAKEDKRPEASDNKSAKFEHEKAGRADNQLTSTTIAKLVAQATVERKVPGADAVNNISENGQTSQGTSDNSDAQGLQSDLSRNKDPEREQQVARESRDATSEHQIAKDSQPPVDIIPLNDGTGKSFSVSSPETVAAQAKSTKEEEPDTKKEKSQRAKTESPVVPADIEPVSTHKKTQKPKPTPLQLKKAAGKFTKAVSAPSQDNPKELKEPKTSDNEADSEVPSKDGSVNMAKKSKKAKLKAKDAVTETVADTPEETRAPTPHSAPYSFAAAMDTSRTENPIIKAPGFEPFNIYDGEQKGKGKEKPSQPEGTEKIGDYLKRIANNKPAEGTSVGSGPYLEIFKVPSSLQEAWERDGEIVTLQSTTGNCHISPTNKTFFVDQGGEVPLSSKSDDDSKTLEDSSLAAKSGKGSTHSVEILNPETVASESDPIALANKKVDAYYKLKLGNSEYANDSRRSQRAPPYHPHASFKEDGFTRFPKDYDANKDEPSAGSPQDPDSSDTPKEADTGVKGAIAAANQKGEAYNDEGVGADESTNDLGRATQAPPTRENADSKDSIKGYPTDHSADKDESSVRSRQSSASSHTLGRSEVSVEESPDSTSLETQSKSTAPPSIPPRSPRRRPGSKAPSQRQSPPGKKPQDVLQKAISRKNSQSSSGSPPRKTLVRSSSNASSKNQSPPGQPFKTPTAKALEKVLARMSSSPENTPSGPSSAPSSKENSPPDPPFKTPTIKAIEKVKEAASSSPENNRSRSGSDSSSKGHSSPDPPFQTPRETSLSTTEEFPALSPSPRTAESSAKPEKVDSAPRPYSEVAAGRRTSEGSRGSRGSRSSSVIAVCRKGIERRASRASSNSPPKSRDASWEVKGGQKVWGKEDRRSS